MYGIEQFIIDINLGPYFSVKKFPQSIIAFHIIHNLFNLLLLPHLIVDFQERKCVSMIH